MNFITELLVLGELSSSDLRISIDLSFVGAEKEDSCLIRGEYFRIFELIGRSLGHANRYTRTTVRNERTN
jgi:hypothetical protein